VGSNFYITSFHSLIMRGEVLNVKLVVANFNGWNFIYYPLFWAFLYF